EQLDRFLDAWQDPEEQVLSREDVEFIFGRVHHEPFTPSLVSPPGPSGPGGAHRKGPGEPTPEGPSILDMFRALDRDVQDKWKELYKHRTQVREKKEKLPGAKTDPVAVTLVLADEQIRAAETNHKEGNDFFQKGPWTKALRRFRAAGTQFRTAQQSLES